MAVKYHCPKCDKKYIDWGAEKLGFKCPDCEGETLVESGLDSAAAKKKKKKKPSLKRKKPAAKKKKKAAKKKAAPSTPISTYEDEDKPEFVPDEFNTGETKAVDDAKG